MFAKRHQFDLVKIYDRYLIAVVLNGFWPVDHLFKKYLMDHFGMLTPDQQLV